MWLVKGFFENFSGAAVCVKLWAGDEPGWPGALVSSLDATARYSGGNVEFVMFEDVNGQEVFVNPKRVIWVREYGNQNTEISCGAEDKFSVRLSPAQAVAALGVKIR